MERLCMIHVLGLAENLLLLVAMETFGLQFVKEEVMLNQIHGIQLRQTIIGKKECTM